MQCWKAKHLPPVPAVVLLLVVFLLLLLVVIDILLLLVNIVNKAVLGNLPEAKGVEYITLGLAITVCVGPFAGLVFMLVLLLGAMVVLASEFTAVFGTTKTSGLLWLCGSTELDQQEYQKDSERLAKEFHSFVVTSISVRSSGAENNEREEV